MKASSGEIGTLNYFPGVFICVCQNRSNRRAFLCLLLIVGMAVLSKQFDKKIQNLLANYTHPVPSLS